LEPGRRTGRAGNGEEKEKADEGRDGANVRLTNARHRQLKSQAATRGLSLSAYVESLLVRAMDNLDTDLDDTKAGGH
jgi:predicted HicB family RNase H-like nuclease